VRGDVTSPTFVIARVHPSLVGGPPLVHVDAYRLGGIDELDDLDLDAALEESVTVVEWGEGLAEGLSADRLEITLSRARGDDPSATEETDEPRGLTLPAVAGPGEPEEPDPRRVRVAPVGDRWIGSHLRRALT
jgi:tRNA threonylcarbamoyladenosine biosynthesis protein TsaE